MTGSHVRVKAFPYDGFLFLCITDQLDYTEILGLLSEEVLLNFVQPSVKIQPSFATVQ